MSSCEYPSTLWDSFVYGRANYVGELSKDRVFSGGGSRQRCRTVDKAIPLFPSSREKLVLVCTPSPFCKRDYAVFAIATPSEVHTSMRRVIDWWTRVVRDSDLDVNETLQVDEKESELFIFLKVIEANRRGNNRDSGRWITAKVARRKRNICLI